MIDEIRFEVAIRTVSGLNVREHPLSRSRRVKKERRAVAQAWALIVATARVMPEWLVESRVRRLPLGLKQRDRALAKATGFDLRQEERVWIPSRALVVEMVRVAPAKLDPGDNLRSAFKGVRDELARQLGVDDRDEVLVSWAEPSQERRGPGIYAVKIAIRVAGGSP